MATTDPAPGLTDTDILIDAARGQSQAIQYISQRQSSGVLRISMISAMELISGCRDKGQLIQVQQFLSPICVLSMTDSISRLAYELMQSFHLSHGLLLPDALIGATCLDHGMVLHTRNIRHFQMIVGLDVKRPY